MLVGNLFDVLRATGDFDGALAVLDSLDLEGLGPQQQASLQMVQMTVLRYREDPGDHPRREVERLAALTAEIPRPAGPLLRPGLPGGGRRARPGTTRPPSP